MFVLWVLVFITLGVKWACGSLCVFVSVHLGDRAFWERNGFVRLSRSLSCSLFLHIFVSWFVFYHLNSLLKRNGFVGLEGVSE